MVPSAELLVRRARRERLEQASSGDAEHALRVLAEVERAEAARPRLIRISSSVPIQVAASISSGRPSAHAEPSRPLDVLEEVELRGFDSVTLAFCLAIAALAWLLLALLVYGLYLGVASW